MRLSLLSSAALFSCGVLVYGRPLSTQRESRGLIPTIAAYDIAPRFIFDSLDAGSDASGTIFNENLPGYPTDNPALPGTSTALFNDIQPIDFTLPSLDTPVSSELKLAGLSSFDTFLSPIELDKSSATGQATQSDFGVGTNTFGNTRGPVMVATDETSPLIIFANPENFQKDLQNLKSGQTPYCIYELSSLGNNLVLKKCGQNPDWEVFSQDIDGSRRGIALYRLNDGSIISIMRVSDKCRKKVWGPDKCTLLECGKQEEATLKKFTQWESSLRAVFPGRNMVQLIDPTWTLAEIGKAESAYLYPNY
ncbi:hypothetical protein MMC29_002676 [Sticta canariensis]|nr:hypothetical protein [Sticta canariensis]